MFRDMAETLQDRLRQRMEELRTNGRKVSIKAGLSPDYVRGVLRNEGSSPRGANLAAVARVLGTTESWLLHGEEPKAALTGNRIVGAAVGSATPRLDNIGDALPANLPIYGTVAASLAFHHEGAFEMETRVIEYVRRPPSLVSVPDAYAFYVAGHSMVPVHNPGDLRFVHPYKPARQGDTVVVQAQYAEHRGIEAFLGLYERRNADKVYIRKLNPEATVEFTLSYVKAIHRVLTVNEMFGV
ncbi:S24 family peptidase [Jiella marina]|uniref:S24 family peptidase n=1 Tax=Jiella sp. LLJ827 TaxID=2917712 RepID=UPI0021014211|nr:S24 family peptidase [Jiella sp. LLJ827]MCQ0986427.1 XRE family transcriptional regulator [Jiella sp. LLJ827]